MPALVKASVCYWGCVIKSPVEAHIKSYTIQRKESP
ncbi:unnamed protein product [Brassica oleracea var. botrytis]|uniref:(rape) hypothetical protein n=1 Tax=Brassica napus TaxID=3708 RepID=A0A816IE96_BRANA|nr:unnamed protein product [Brassica napus]